MLFHTIIPLRLWAYLALILFAYYNFDIGGLVVAVAVLVLIGG